MYSIFFDLETSDLLRVGQILNFAFVLVDDDFNEVDSLAAKVKISRLQLPRAAAILSNRTDVLKHQSQAHLSEAEAIRDILNFWAKHARINGKAPLPLIGYNSFNFDLPFLRTVAIRNGFNPYISGIINRDMLVMSRYLRATNEDFKGLLGESCLEGDEELSNQQPDFSVSLENISRRFGLLHGEQAHESLADVRLTIDVAREFINLMEADIRTFEPYKVTKLTSLPKASVVKLNEAITRNSPNEAGEFFYSYDATLLEGNQRYALWVDLDRVNKLVEKEGVTLSEVNQEALKRCIRWRKGAEHLVWPGEEKPSENSISIAPQVLEQCSGINLSNFFGENDCDIEQFIWRLPIPEIEKLASAIERRVEPESDNKDCKQLYRRYLLENWTGGYSESFTKLLKRYAQYRYNGQLKTSNSDMVDSEGSSNESGGEENVTNYATNSGDQSAPLNAAANKPIGNGASDKEDRGVHPTIDKLLAEITRALKKTKDEGKAEDERLLVALHQFYVKSEIYQILLQKGAE